MNTDMKRIGRAWDILLSSSFSFPRVPSSVGTVLPSLSLARRILRRTDPDYGTIYVGDIM